jgi:hypothetical protein
MSPAERLAEARGMAVLATDLLARGFQTAAGEMLWGAVNHIINAIVDHHGLVGNTGNSLGRRQTMEFLQNVNPRTPPLGDSLAVVGELHGHFYNKHMSDAQHAEAIAATFELVEYLLNRPEVQAIP